MSTLPLDNWPLDGQGICQGIGTVPDSDDRTVRSVGSGSPLRRPSGEDATCVTQAVWPEHAERRKPSRMMVTLTTSRWIKLPLAGVSRTSSQFGLIGINDPWGLIRERHRSNRHGWKAETGSPRHHPVIQASLALFLVAVGESLTRLRRVRRCPCGVTHFSPNECLEG